MPFYEYECPSCKYYAEVLQKITEKPLKKCPSCGKAGFRKLVSAPVFRLKGSGWYETDFKGDGDNKRNLAGADKDAPAADAKTSAETKADAKPATDAKDGAAAGGEGKAETKAEAKPAAESKSSDGKRSRAAAKGKRGGGRTAQRRPAAKKAPARGGKRR
jgi:putative FmdB family regulatory protein